MAGERKPPAPLKVGAKSWGLGALLGFIVGAGVDSYTNDDGMISRGVTKLDPVATEKAEQAVHIVDSRKAVPFPTTHQGRSPEEAAAIQRRLYGDTVKSQPNTEVDVIDPNAPISPSQQYNAEHKTDIVDDIISESRDTLCMAPDSTASDCTKQHMFALIGTFLGALIALKPGLRARSKAIEKLTEWEGKNKGAINMTAKLNANSGPQEQERIRRAIYDKAPPHTTPSSMHPSEHTAEGEFVGGKPAAPQTEHGGKKLEKDPIEGEVVSSSPAKSFQQIAPDKAGTSAVDTSALKGPTQNKALPKPQDKPTNN